MSRKYLNDKYCVRCNRTTPCPYLKSNYDKIMSEAVEAYSCGKYSSIECGYPIEQVSVLDVGCGNGRNSKFMKKKGHTVTSLDMVNDYGTKCILGKGKMPVKSKSMDIILCNYLLMFLDDKERDNVIKEFQRVARKHCIIMLELYPAKDSYAKDENAMLKMQKDIFDKLGWNKIKYSQGRFIAINEYVEIGK